MRLYSSHFVVPDPRPNPGAAPRERWPVMVRDGFCWSGLVLGWLVFLRPGSWLLAALTGLVSLLIGLAGGRVPGAWTLLPGLHLAIALFAADWRRWELGLAGTVPGPIVAAASPEAALLRLLDRHPGLLVALPAVPGAITGAVTGPGAVADEAAPGVGAV